MKYGFNDKTPANLRAIIQGKDKSREEKQLDALLKLSYPGRMIGFLNDLQIHKNHFNDISIMFLTLV